MKCTLRNKKQGWRLAGTVMLTTLMAIAVLTATACGAKLPPNTTPEAKVAIYTSQALTVADRILTQLDQLTERRLALATTDQQKEDIKKQTRAVAAVVAQIGETGEKLSAALKTWAAIHQALGDEKNAAGKVRVLLEALQALIPQVTAPITDVNLRNNVATVLDIVSTLVLNVGGLVPAPAP